MKRTPWFPGSVVPARRGWYERDHRRCYAYDNPKDRRISLDLWEPVPDGDSLYPGVWYVQEERMWFVNVFTGEEKLLDGINDASHQQLPWRGLTKEHA